MSVAGGISCIWSVTIALTSLSDGSLPESSLDHIRSSVYTRGVGNYNDHGIFLQGKIAHDQVLCSTSSNMCLSGHVHVTCAALHFHMIC